MLSPRKLTRVIRNRNFFYAAEFNTWYLSREPFSLSTVCENRSETKKKKITSAFQMFISKRVYIYIHYLYCSIVYTFVYHIILYYYVQIAGATIHRGHPSCATWCCACMYVCRRFFYYYCGTGPSRTNRIFHTTYDTQYVFTHTHVLRPFCWTVWCLRDPVSKGGSLVGRSIRMLWQNLIFDDNYVVILCTWCIIVNYYILCTSIVSVVFIWKQINIPST